MEPAIDGSYGILKNGNWTGIRGQLQRKVMYYHLSHVKILIFRLFALINHGYFWIKSDHRFFSLVFSSFSY